MNILKIEIENITAFEGVQVIDFTQEPLRSAGLFAITGSTGAGKSTILDAICLALYNKAPRLENSERVRTETTKPGPKTVEQLASDNPANMLRRGAKQGRAAVTFSLSDGAVYEATWSVSINRNGNLNPPTQTVRCLRPHKREWTGINEVKRLIPMLINLDYDQFTRTVILAQNSFAKFLNAKQNEKSDLLQKITGTQLFERISVAIHQRCAEARDAVRVEESRLEGIRLYQMNETELADNDETKRLAEGKRSHYANRIQLIDNQLAWYQRYAQAQAEEEHCKKQLLEVQRQDNAQASERSLLERRNLLLPFSENYFSVKGFKADIQRIKEQTAQKQQERQALQAELEPLRTAHQSALGRFDSVNSEWEQRQAQFERGSKLEGKLQVLRNEVDDIVRELRAHHIQQDSLMQEQAKYQSQLAENQKLLAETESKVKEMATHERMAQAIEQVKYRLKDLLQAKMEYERAEKSLAEDAAKLAVERDKELKASKRDKELLAEIQGYSERLDLVRLQIRNQDSIQLQTRLQQANTRVLQAQRALDLWDQIVKLYNELDEKEVDVRSRELSLEHLDKERQKAETAVAIAARAYDVAQRNYSLSQTENTKSLRAELREGEPCPICGSMHHPYASEKERELGHILSGLEESYKETAADLETARRHAATLQRDHAEQSGQLKQLRVRVEEINKQVAVCVGNWTQFEALDASFHGCGREVNRVSRHTILAQIVDGARREEREADKLVQEFNKHQVEVRDLNENIRRATGARNLNAEQLHQCVTNYRVLRDKVAAIEQRIGQQKGVFARLQSELDQMITVPLWHSEWEHSPGGFAQKVNAIAETWLRMSDTLLRTQEQLRELLNLLQGTQKSLQSLGLLIGQLDNKLSGRKLEVQRLEGELTSMFGQLTTKQARAELQGRLLQSEREEKSRRDQYARKQDSLTTLQGELLGLERQRGDKEILLREAQQRLDRQMLRFNNDQTNVLQYHELENVLGDARDWNALRVQLDATREALTLARREVERAQQTVATLRRDPQRPAQNDEESEPTLRGLREQLIRQRDEADAQLAECIRRRQLHEQTLQALQAAAPQMERLQGILHQWQDLDVVLGSASGAKFRDIAQAYTFGILVNHANHHLAHLTSRYRLRCKPGTLALEAIDQDMLGQARNVNSLSGGETFIVSLALALGLSSLSSQQINICSLFIDEGFGNLDSRSLDEVVADLGRLQHVQGRKVGVISHTEQIQSRISPQVLVQKSPRGGKSRILID